MDKIQEIFRDQALIKKIQAKLPYLFQLAALNSMRGGKIGMEVGSIRERIIIAMLIYKFGEQNVQTEFPITKSEVDVAINENMYSIKTITRGKLTGGVKLTWTVDAQKAQEFRETYIPSCGMILIHINWASNGGLYYFSKSLQNKVLKQIGRSNYIKLPKLGTNPRGVEMTNKALQLLDSQKEKFFIPINWSKTKIDYNPFKRWVNYWQEK